MSPWWKKPEPVAPEVVEQIEAVEIPVITEVKRRFAKGDYAAALLEAYPKAANDLSRGFKIPFPAGMTHEEFLRTKTTPEMGHLPEFFHRFYALYAPLRYGPPGKFETPKELPGILESIYAHRAMWRLYLQPKEESAPHRRHEAPTAPGETSAPGAPADAAGSPEEPPAPRGEEEASP
jgi:hypothetical protein